jgi:hypothetical protein
MSGHLKLDEKHLSATRLLHATAGRSAAQSVPLRLPALVAIGDVIVNLGDRFKIGGRRPFDVEAM